MPAVASNGISLYYEIYGDGPPLVLISGLGGDRTFWSASVERLSPRFRVIVFDTRGIGKSDAPREPYTMEQFADDLAGLLDAIGIERAHVLGFSMGGNIALAFALRYPERVDKLVLASSFAVMNKQARLFLDAVLSVYEGGATSKMMFDLIAPWLFSASFLDAPANAAYLQYDENDPDQQPFYAWKNQYLAQQAFDVVSRLREIEKPTLVISGQMDRLAHEEDSVLLAEKIKNAIHRSIPGSGHLVNYEDPDSFHDSILAFL